MRHVTKRSRDLTVLIAIVSVVAIGFAAMIAVSLLEDDGAGSEVSGSPGLPDGVPTAVVHENLDEACAALEEAGTRGKDKRTAEADQEELVEEYLQEPGTGPAIGIGLTVCGRGWVVVVGARAMSSVLPAVGSRGTPVIAHYQPPFVAD
jgi:hypothetical protein